MNRQEVLTMAGYLVGLILVCVVFVPQVFQKYILLISAAGWTLAMYHETHKKKRQEQMNKPMQVIDLEPDYKKLFAQQLLLRIHEKVKSRFPDAVVELTENDMLRMVTSKRAICVAVSQAEQFSHMNIGLHEDGSICMNLFSLVDLEQIHFAEKKTATNKEEEPDLRTWYEQKGQRVFTELITSVNSRGYRKLSIKENGDVMVEGEGHSVVKDYFPEFPKKKDWKKLKALLSESAVDVQTTGKAMTLSW